MNQDVTSFKPFFLSEEETMALLDLCLTSSSDMDDTKEQVMRKLTELAHCHLRESMAREADTAAVSDRDGMTAEEPACPLAAGETLRSDAEHVVRERLTPTTMMARSTARTRNLRRHIDCHIDLKHAPNLTARESAPGSSRHGARRP